jgi:nucleoporin NUP82
MTLWVAMRGGDVYALCPLLPQRWAPPPSMIPSLSVTIVAKSVALDDDMAAADEKQLAQQQLEWMADLDNQEPKVLETALGEEPVEVYARPSHPGVIPRLQGPFEMESSDSTEDDLDMELTDVYVIGQKIESEELMEGEEADLETDGDGLSLPVVCLVSTSGQLKICLGLDAVEARWLPPRTKSKPAVAVEEEDAPPSLLVFQLFDLLRPAEVNSDGWPMFSEDVTSRYSFFITHSAGITHVSLSSWVFRLETELQAEAGTGSDFRMDVLVKASASELNRVYSQDVQLGPLTAAVALQDPDLGYSALSANQAGPVAIVFESEGMDMRPLEARAEPAVHEEDTTPPPDELWHPRPVFQPSGALSMGSRLPNMLESLRRGKYASLLQQPMRPDATTLSLLMDVHRVLHSEVKELNPAVAELFRKCETLRIDLRGQVARANQVRAMVDTIAGNDPDNEPLSDNELVQHRLEKAASRREELARRTDTLKARLGKATSRELSDKETAWTEEVKAVEANVCTGPDSDEQDTRPSGRRNKHMWQRMNDVKTLKDDLVAQMEQIRGQADSATSTFQNGTGSPSHELRIPPMTRKVKMDQVKGLLERETALVEAVKGRLARLSIG